LQIVASSSFGTTRGVSCAWGMAAPPMRIPRTTSHIAAVTRAQNGYARCARSLSAGVATPDARGNGRGGIGSGRAARARASRSGSINASSGLMGSMRIVIGILAAVLHPSRRERASSLSRSASSSACSAR